MIIYRIKSTTFFLLIMIFVFTLACNTITNPALNAPHPAGTTETALPTEMSATPQGLLSPNSTPLPGGLILKSQNDTRQIFEGFQVTFLEDQAENFLPENQNEIDMYFGENQNFTIHVKSSLRPLAWATGWCASGSETLDQNLEKIQFEMSVNGQKVDLSQVFKIDKSASFHTAGNLCTMYIIVAHDWPSGTTTLTSKTIITEPINNGARDYLPGELSRVYTVINSGGSRPFPNSPVLGSIEETQNAINEQVETLGHAASEKYSTENPVGGTRNYTIHLIDPNRHLMWFHGWCAKDSNILTQNLKSINFELQVNGQSVNLDTALSSYYKTSKGLYCYAYNIVMYGWPPETTEITTKVIILNPINDGIADYKAGEITTIHTVINP